MESPDERRAGEILRQVEPEDLQRFGLIPEFIGRVPVLAHGRIELLWYVREQSISNDYHRYGNLGGRGSEERAPVT